MLIDHYHPMRLHLEDLARMRMVASQATALKLD
jgi:hypothetical protein